MSKNAQCLTEPTLFDANAGDPLTLFGILWGAVAIFHVMGPSGAAAHLVSHPTMLGFSQAALAISAISLMIKPYYNTPLILVALLGLITAWQEAPVLGNHWLLAAFINLALLLSAVARLQYGGLNRDRLAGAFFPLARWCLLGFYSFAAFSKLNSAFFDTSVSCSTSYFDETARSLGLGIPLTVGAGGLALLLPVLTAVTELSIPILLVAERTRVFGVTLGVGFHSLIALDRLHPFIDFSSVLTALFVLFLPPQFSEAAVGFLKDKGGRLLIAWMAVACVVLGAQWIDLNDFEYSVFIQGRMILWYIFDAVIIAGLTLWLTKYPKQVLKRPFTIADKRLLWLAVVPALVALNGVLPYFELRTAYAYTMYSNLQMVNGKSNHLIVRSSFPVAGRQADLVKIIRSSDDGLNLYAAYDYLLPWDSFRAYLAKRPNVAVVYERGNLGYVIYRVADQPELTTPPSLLAQKLLAMRAVDAHDPPRCQEVFLPAL